VKRLMQSTAFVRAIMGPFGSGKSVGCTMDLLRQAVNQPPDDSSKRRSRFVVVRNTYRQLSDTTIKTVHDWIPPGVAGKWLKSDKTFLLNFGDVESEWIFRALDDPDDVANMMSLEVTSAWVNEYRSIDAEVFAAILGRVGRFPKKKFVPPWYGVIMDSNPPDEETFFHTLFEEELPPEMQQYASLMESVGRPLLELFKQPSGLSEEAENVENLPDHYYETILVGGRDEDYIRKHVHGEYGRALGGQPVFPDFLTSHHVSRTPLMPNTSEPMGMGVDFGLTPAVVFFQQIHGRWFVFKEIIAQEPIGFEQFLDTRVVPMVARWFPDHTEFSVWADPAGTQRSQADEKTCFQILKKFQFTPRPGPKDLTTRIASVTRALTRTVSGLPGIVFDPACHMLIAGLRGKYKYRLRKNEAQEWDPVPLKNKWSHIADALQYGIGAYEGPAVQRSNNKPRPWAGHKWVKPIEVPRGGVWGE